MNKLASQPFAKRVFNSWVLAISPDLLPNLPNKQEVSYKEHVSAPPAKRDEFRGREFTVTFIEASLDYSWLNRDGKRMFDSPVYNFLQTLERKTGIIMHKKPAASYSVLMTALKSGEADFAVTFVYFTPERLKILDSTAPVAIGPLCLVMKRAPYFTFGMVLLSPYEFSTWTALLLSMCAFAVIWYVVNVFSLVQGRYIKTSSDGSISHAILDVVQVVLSSSCTRLVQTNAQRVAFTAALFFAVVVSNAYSGQLLGLLAHPPRHKDPQNLQEAARIIETVYLTEDLKAVVISANEDGTLTELISKIKPRHFGFDLRVLQRMATECRNANSVYFPMYKCRPMCLIERNSRLEESLLDDQNVDRASKACTRAYRRRKARTLQTTQCYRYDNSRVLREPPRLLKGIENTLDVFEYLRGRTLRVDFPYHALLLVVLDDGHRVVHVFGQMTPEPRSELLQQMAFVSTGETSDDRRAIERLTIEEELETIRRSVKGQSSHGIASESIYRMNFSLQPTTPPFETPRRMCIRGGAGERHNNGRRRGELQGRARRGLVCELNSVGVDGDEAWRRGARGSRAKKSETHGLGGLGDAARRARHRRALGASRRGQTEGDLEAASGEIGERGGRGGGQKQGQAQGDVPMGAKGAARRGAAWRAASIASPQEASRGTLPYETPLITQMPVGIYGVFIKNPPLPGGSVTKRTWSARVSAKAEGQMLLGGPGAHGRTGGRRGAASNAEWPLLSIVRYRTFNRPTLIHCQHNLKFLLSTEGSSRKLYVGSRTFVLGSHPLGLLGAADQYTIHVGEAPGTAELASACSREVPFKRPAISRAAPPRTGRRLSVRTHALPRQSQPRAALCHRFPSGGRDAGGVPRADVGGGGEEEATAACFSIQLGTDLHLTAGRARRRNGLRRTQYAGDGGKRKASERRRGRGRGGGALMAPARRLAKIGHFVECDFKYASRYSDLSCLMVSTGVPARVGAAAPRSPGNALAISFGPKLETTRARGFLDVRVDHNQTDKKYHFINLVNFSDSSLPVGSLSLGGEGSVRPRAAMRTARDHAHARASAHARAAAAAAVARPLGSVMRGAAPSGGGGGGGCEGGGGDEATGFDFVKVKRKAKAVDVDRRSSVPQRGPWGPPGDGSRAPGRSSAAAFRGPPSAPVLLA
ncbi:Protein of unknown function [Gryllus bimaculatus]|nr:Protein of unknown function [Gryllus bimaculatus]